MQAIRAAMFMIASTLSISGALSASVSGTLYADEGLTPVSGVVTLDIYTSSAIYQTTAIDGIYNLPNMILSPGMTVSVCVAGDAATRAFVITKTSSTSDITGLDIYQNHVIIRQEASSGDSISNTDLAAFDNHRDKSVQFAVDRESLLIFGGQELYIWSGKTFIPGGPVTIASDGSSSKTDGSLSLAPNASFIAGGGIKLGGNWHAATGSTFRPNSNAVTFNATTVGKTISGALDRSSAFYKLAFDGIGGGWTITDSIRVSAANAVDTFVIHNGSVTLGNGTSTSLEIDGQMAIAGMVGDVGSFTTAPVATGSQTIVDLNNNAAPPSCGNCIISIGAVSGSGHGGLQINKNALVRLNSSSASESAIIVNATGRLQIEGEETTTGTVRSLAQSPVSSTITDEGSRWKDGQFKGLVARISNTGSLAFGQIYTIFSSTESRIVVSATSTPNDPNPTVTGTTCSGNGLCVIAPSLSLLSEVDPVGRYMHNVTDDKYYLIASTTIGGQGKYVIANNDPDDFTTMATGKSIEITDGIRPGDSFQILSYAAVTAQSGLGCGSRTDPAATAYIRSQAGSKNLIRYADICDLGRDELGKSGLEFDGLNGAIGDQGTITVEYSRIRNNSRGIFLSNSRNMSGTFGIRNNFIQHSGGGGIVGETASNNDLSYNRVSLSGGGGGVYLYNESNGNSLIGNISHHNVSTGISIENSNNNQVDSNIVFRNESGAGGLFLKNSSNTQVDNLTSFANGTPSTKMVGFGMLSFGGSNNLIASSTFFANVRSGIVVADSPGNAVIDNRSFANGYHGMVQVCEARDYSVTLFRNQFYLNHFGGLMLENSGNCSAYVISDRYGTLGSNGVVDLAMGAAGASHPGTDRLYLFDTILASPTSAYLREMAASIDQSYFIISRKHNGVAGSTHVWGHYVAPPERSSDLDDYASNLWEKSVTAPVFTNTEGTRISRWLDRAFFASENRPRSTFRRWLDRLGNASSTRKTIADLHYAVGSADISGGPYYYRLTAMTSTCPIDCAFAVWRNGVLVGTATVGQEYTDSNGFGFTIDGGSGPYEVGATYSFTAWDASNDSQIAKRRVMHSD